MKKNIVTLFLISSTSIVASDSIFNQTATITYTKESASNNRLDKEEVLKSSAQLNLAEVLSENYAEIQHTRTSAIGSDIVLRGQQKDNINVVIDGAKIHGACPNRMDPPAMHVSSLQLEHIEVKKGPFDVAHFGALAGSVNLTTRDPQVGKSGMLDISLGSFGYRKFGFVSEVGDDKLKVLVGASQESSGQYEDGDGNSLFDQNQTSSKPFAKYSSSYKNTDAMSRQQGWIKAVFTPNDSQELKVSLYGDSAKDVLYPAFGMDAQIDDTMMINAIYSVNNLSKYSDKLSIQFYRSEVDHEMGNEFREYSLDPMGYRTHKIESSIDGLKLENEIKLSSSKITIGLDTSNRNWNSQCLAEPSRMVKANKLPDVTTINKAIYFKGEKVINNYDLNYGLRYDVTKISAGKSVYQAANMMNNFTEQVVQNSDGKKFNNISANLLAKYNYTKDTSVYFGLGQSVRVPDANEMYMFKASNSNLDETINREIDLGIEYQMGLTVIKTSAFYSQLKDFIYAYKDGMNLNYANIDATIYGIEALSTTLLNDVSSLDLSFAYQIGEKDAPLTNQNDTNLAGITPMKFHATYKYELDDGVVSMSMIAASSQENIDSDNGEIEIGGYKTFSAKYVTDIIEDIELSIGMDNITNETYAVNNTYVGRNLLPDATDMILLNEAGRYSYINAKYRF